MKKYKFKFAVINKFFNEVHEDAVFDYYRRAEHLLDKIEAKFREEYIFVSFVV